MVAVPEVCAPRREAETNTKAEETGNKDSEIMSEQLPEKCCGKCKWWDAKREVTTKGSMFGTRQCNPRTFIMPSSVRVVPFDFMHDYEGTSCPCFEAKEKK